MERKGPVLMGKYELGRLLGQGTFAKVHRARNLETGMSVAIKIVDKERVLKVGMMDQIKREISIMRLVRHPNVVELYEVMATKTKIYIVMEYAKGGELFNKVVKGKLKEDAARRYFQQLISAVDFCHSRGVCHRDLKPENLLLDEHGNLKVTDFGLSALAETKHEDGLLHTTCGTPAYVAPEVINRRGYDGCKTDIWFCGVILYVLLAGYLPFQDSNLMEMYRKIGKGEFKFPNWFAPEVRRLLLKILDPNPSTRISIEKIKEHPWFRKGLDCKPEIVDTEVKELAIVPQTRTPCSNLNAFDIISLSAGFDLSGLFEGKEQKKEVRFTSNKTASTIISKLEDISKRLKMKIKKKDEGLLKIEGSKEGRKGTLEIDAEIFEITPFFHLVEVKKSNGDTLEYQKVMKQDIRPALSDIVWAWQGEPPLQQPLPPPPTTENQESQQFHAAST
ncbi:SNF1-RELATED PROTEIN KINASE 3.8, CBL-INTERACTING PROTEIN KINASE 10, SOS3-interacting protein 1 [Hibiscus trionum]|uniref:non-specific serine/threonine protein kinase n=1 Tax=Hibiscus trionum TaxID=183268 RepID=A0A9W7IS44_HIBTR|nr:SNF1-RELATED PROTEIN KINASE 3.8, CBL-INTERACTING PROTEIN KINASE 10, SOS3-interacting protein 1 [Hibiscus trionum]